MKKLLLLVSSAAISFSITAQSLQFVNLSPASTSLTGPNNQTFQSIAFVQNVGTVTLTVKITRTINNLAANHASNFCFAGVCYPAITNTSLTVNIDPGAVVDTANVKFTADLNPVNTNGISEVTYCAYDVDNPSDSICISFHYFADGVSVNELSGNSRFLSNAYPNPANKSSFVSYNLPTVINAQLVISNMLGSELKRFQLTDKTGSVELPVSTLPEGVYYYTLTNDSKPLISKRLMVSHN